MMGPVDPSKDNGEQVMRSSREEIRSYQDAELKSVLARAWEGIGFYSDLWERRGERPDTGPATFEDWPLWNVADLREAMEKHPPFGNLYTEEGMADIRFIHSSSGTTGKPRYAAFTAVDEPEVFRAYGRVGRMIGLRSDDVFCETGGYGLPIGAWSYTRMAQAVGATVVPVGSGKITPSDKLIDVIHDIGVTALEGAPSYLMHVGRKAQASGRSLRDSKVRLLSLGGESASPAVRAELEGIWGTEIITQTYANSDVSWIAGECLASSEQGGTPGMHIIEDVVRAEVLDPEDGRLREDGEYGELVLTSWLRPSTPRIRFRTGDRAAIDRSPCPCGRTAARLLPLAGRTDDAIRYHGVTIWPLAVEDVLTELTGARREFYLEMRSSENEEKGLGLVVERLDGELAIDPESVTRGIQQRLNVKMTVTVVAPGETHQITRLGTQTKTRRFIDSTV